MTQVHPSSLPRHSQELPSSRGIAHKLLIELLTHQFAFPVQWIDTQKEFLDNEKHVRRFIEIGPAKVLATLAKKSVDRSIGETDMLHSVNREFLFTGDENDFRKITYEYEGEKNRPSDTSEPKNSTPKPISNVPEPVKRVADPLLPPPASRTQVVVPDVDLLPTDVIVAIVAQKFRKAFDEIPVDTSIRLLSGGKSVLQNEIIGDLAAEFGDLPEGSEDWNLDALGANLISAFSGKPGKQMGKLIERLFASKMPGGFSRADAHNYLEMTWGLDTNRRTAVLCCCVTMEPPTRLSEIEQAHAFIDTVVTRYGAQAGISPQMRSANEITVQPSVAIRPIDEASLEAMKKDQNAFLYKQFQILARHLNIEKAVGNGSDHVASEMEKQEELGDWRDELGDEFLAGVQGVFSPLQERRYKSWWNWAREDLSRLLNTTPSEEAYQKISATRLQALINRWSSTLEDMLIHHSKAGAASDTARHLLSYRPTAQNTPPAFRYCQQALGPRTIIDDQGQLTYTEVPRKQYPDSEIPIGYSDLIRSAATNNKPFVNLRKQAHEGWEFDVHLTNTYLNLLSAAESPSGLNFSNKTALVTGAGPGSIGAEIVCGLLAGGATVIVTTSRAPSVAAKFFRQMYKDSGARGSELILLPFNAASKKDCEALMAHIYSKSGLGLDLDFIVPFAAIPEAGRQLDGLDGHSELAHRAMLVNVERLIGLAAQAKDRQKIRGRPATVVLPLSPNHGDFGGDGLYSESKLGLETLFSRFHSERWSAYVSIIGAVIGWTRGTGLMTANNIVAEGIEDLGVLTFAPTEMGLNILALLCPPIIALADVSPIYADLSGGLLGFKDFKKISEIRKEITTKRRVRRALVAERIKQEATLNGTSPEPKDDQNPKPTRVRSNIRQMFPKLSDHASMTVDVEKLVDAVDLSRTIVITGFSELGPWGSSRTRWEMEKSGQLSHNGLTEMAWIMGLIAHFDGVIQGKPYVGWVDKKTSEPVNEADFRAKYETHIMNHAGIRVIDLERLDGYDPSRKEFLHELVVDDDLPPFEVSEHLAKAFKLRHGDKATISPKPGMDPDTWIVTVKRGATFLVPKSIPSDQFVAGQLPSGWDPATYGIPEDIVAQVDPITLYVLCCVCEAMYSAGIQDPYELYQYIHVSEFANCVGTGVGSLTAARAMYQKRYLEKSVQSDILQETYLNSMAAWTNMLIFGAAGPIKTPTGTCATAVESLDAACEAILSRRVKAALVGGVDDFAEEMSHEFQNMKATSNGKDETTRGFLPSEMSRPMASSRAGFMESAGCGVQIVMTAELALEMGLPIYGIVAYTQLGGDGISRSVPAPGQGILTAAREDTSAAQSPLLSLPYRRAELEKDIAEIDRWRRSRLETTISNPDETADARIIEAAANCRKRDAQWMWNSNIRQLDPLLSPMRTALAPWGLTVDDISVASFHGTSTKANDKNESQVINQQMKHLGRSKGNPLLVICQKYLTGHPKGAAGAWMLNGCLQVLNTGIVPGNRNLDDVEPALEAFEHLVYPSEAIQTDDIKACMLTSFGFGQKGGLVILISPRMLFAAVTPKQYGDYRQRVTTRRHRIDPAFQLAMMQNAVFKAKDEGPWPDSRNLNLLEPQARLPRV
ncbi:putative fatty acid synthase alpha subunit [Rosellinia necatrix]|uniref:beta-ketoacyl-[acyl-carrier-protein] synthase I n=1 Tax=Rosellinia necatrix TaxID=77044 RepID=A0A1W2TWE7_ROSNE|nr:putative fatty acid synthase alpha subunit [Rosellinia necatrix]